jgi:hypothetical protein
MTQADIDAKKKEDSQASVIAPSINTSQKTTGEKYYNVLKFAVAETVIVGVTAVTAYWAKYSERTAFNIFGGIQGLVEKAFSPLTKIGKDGSKLRKFGGTVAALGEGASATWHGGTLFIPVMKWLDDSKQKFVHYFNAHYGKPGEVEAGEERVKNEPKKSWGDIIKGRLASWAIVFTSMNLAVFAVGNGKNGRSHFGNFEEAFGRWIAGFTKEGKELSKISVNKVPRLEDPRLKTLNHPQANNKAYRFGKILAIDIYATAVAIFIWNVVSAISAKKRHKQSDAHEVDRLESAQQPIKDNAESFSHASNLQPRVGSHSEAVAAERVVAEKQLAQAGL